MSDTFDADELGVLAPGILYVPAYLDLEITGFNVVFLAWFAQLPTTLPATSGVAWNNGGIPCVS